MNRDWASSQFDMNMCPNHIQMFVTTSSSALAHVLLGQFKTAIIMILATILFGARYSAMQLLGAAGAVLGIVLYSQVTLGETNMNSKDESKGALPLLDSKRKDVL